MVKGFINDIQRLVEITPTQDCTDQIIFADVYDRVTGDFIRTVNQVQVAAEQNRYVVGVKNNNAPTQESFTVAISGRDLNADAWVLIREDVHNTTEAEETVAGVFDSQAYRDYKIEVTAGSNVTVVTSTIELVDRGFDPTGVVVGDSAGVKLVVPCDFRGLDPGDHYSIVFVAENVGVVARDILLVFGGDGFQIEEVEE